MQVYNKLKAHVDDIALNKSAKFAFYRFLEILNRRVPLPNSTFRYSIADVYTEKYLEEYMCPRDGYCFVDVGASIGHWTIFVAKKGFEVHSFEPSPRPYSILKRRVRRYSNVHVYPIALGESQREATLMLFESFSPHSVVGSLADYAQMQKRGLLGRVQIPVRTLDSFGFTNVGLIKIDTEGYEVPILLGAEQTIRECKPRLIIEVHPPFDVEKRRIIEILEDLNYHYIVRHKTGLICQPHIIGEYSRE